MNLTMSIRILLYIYQK